MSLLAVIPVRKGSKRLPGKNLLKISGESLIARTVRVAKESGVFAEILVSTDCEAMAREARSAGASVPFLRPSGLAKDDSSSVDVALHGLEYLESMGSQYESLCLLQVTSPFLKGEQLLKAYEIYKVKGWGSCSSAYQVREPYEWQWQMESGVARPVDPSKFTKPARDFPKRLIENGAFYFVKTSHLKGHKSLYNLDNHGLFEMEYLESVDIDTKKDFEFALVVEGFVKGN